MTFGDLVPLAFQRVLPYALWVLGAGFLVVNLVLFGRVLRYWRLRDSMVLSWTTPKSRSYAISLGFGLIFGVLVFVKIVVSGRPPVDAFGEGDVADRGQ